MRKPDWQSEDGRVQLYCGDCVPMLPHLRADAVITDPPYGIGFAAQPTKWQRRAGTKPTEWDSHPGNIDGLLSIGDMTVIWGGNYFSLPPSRGWLTWFKPDAPPSMASFEMAWTSRDMNARQIVHSISATNAERVGHPTQKPVRVITWCMDQVRVPYESTVLDPFMGSGTTAISCLRTGRLFIGIEKSPEYFDIAVKRIETALRNPGLFTSAESA